MLVSRPVAADSIRQAVSDHVSSELSRSESESSSSSSSSSDSEASASTTSEVGDGTASGGTATDPFAIWPWPAIELPGVRLFGRPAHFAFTLERGVQFWMPAQHPAVRLEAETYQTWRLEVRGEIGGLFALHQLVFEADGRAWLPGRGPSITPGIGPGLGGAARALAVIGLPLLGSSWLQPVFRYEASTFATTALPTRPVCLVARGADTAADPPACDRTVGPLRMASTFESFVLGLAVVRPDGLGSAYVGLDVTSQRKPYQVNVDGRALDDYLFDARFRGMGLAMGFHLGGEQGLRAGAGLRLGAVASVSLTDDLALEDVLPEGWSLGYTRWEADLSYGKVLWRGPPVLELRLGVDASGSEFTYHRSGVDGAPSLNRDLFFAARIALVALL
jgi:hypothetical protein